MTQFAELKEFSDRVGTVFGTEDFALMLYSLVRMQRPEVMVELGAGCLVTSLWMALAARENGQGKVYAVDDGSHWPQVIGNASYPFSKDERISDYLAYVDYLKQRFDVTERLELISQRMPPYPAIGKSVDLLFSDFSHGPQAIISLFAHYFSRLSPSANVFIDSASTFYPSYAYLEMLVPILNKGIIPASLLQCIAEADRDAARAYVSSSRFTLVHLTEVKNRAQNSTAWLKIEPLDTQPYPMTSFHQ